MLYQNTDAGYTVIVVIALAAIFVFVIMLIAAFAIVRSERKTKTAAPSKDELESGSPAVGNTTLLPEDATTTEVSRTIEIEARSFAAGFAGLFSRDRPRNASASGQRAILDRFPNAIGTLNWVICFIVATCVAWLNYSRVAYVVNTISLYPYFVLLAVLSPTCLAVAWLRLTGMKWRQSLMLFIWVSVAFGGIWLISQLGFIFKYLSGQCC